MNISTSKDFTGNLIIQFERIDKTLYLDELNKITILSQYTNNELFSTYLSPSSVERIIYMIHDILEDKDVQSEFLNIGSDTERNFKSSNIMKFHLRKIKEEGKEDTYLIQMIKLRPNKGFVRIKLSKDNIEDFLDNLYNTFVDYY